MYSQMNNENVKYIWNSINQLKWLFDQFLQQKVSCVPSHWRGAAATELNPRPCDFWEYLFEEQILGKHRIMGLIMTHKLILAYILAYNNYKIYKYNNSLNIFLWCFFRVTFSQSFSFSLMVLYNVFHY